MPTIKKCARSVPDFGYDAESTSMLTCSSPCITTSTRRRNINLLIAIVIFGIPIFSLALLITFSLVASPSAKTGSASSAGRTASSPTSYLQITPALSLQIVFEPEFADVKFIKIATERTTTAAATPSAQFAHRFYYEVILIAENSINNKRGTFLDVRSDPVSTYNTNDVKTFSEFRSTNAAIEIVSQIIRKLEETDPDAPPTSSSGSATPTTRFMFDKFQFPDYLLAYSETRSIKIMNEDEVLFLFYKMFFPLTCTSKVEKMIAANRDMNELGAGIRTGVLSLFTLLSFYFSNVFYVYIKNTTKIIEFDGGSLEDEATLRCCCTKNVLSPRRFRSLLTLLFALNVVCFVAQIVVLFELDLGAKRLYTEVAFGSGSGGSGCNANLQGGTFYQQFPFVITDDDGINNSNLGNRLNAYNYRHPWTLAMNSAAIAARANSSSSTTSTTAASSSSEYYQRFNFLSGWCGDSSSSSSSPIIFPQIISICTATFMTLSLMLTGFFVIRPLWKTEAVDLKLGYCITATEDEEEKRVARGRGITSLSALSRPMRRDDEEELLSIGRARLGGRGGAGRDDDDIDRYLTRRSTRPPPKRQTLREEEEEEEEERRKRQAPKDEAAIIAQNALLRRAANNNNNAAVQQSEIVVIPQDLPFGYQSSL